VRRGPGEGRRHDPEHQLLRRAGVVAVRRDDDAHDARTDGGDRDDPQVLPQKDPPKAVAPPCATAGVVAAIPVADVDAAVSSTGALVLTT
jgi:hypothetical protein